MACRKERFGDQAAQDWLTIRMILQQLDGGDECADGIQTEPGHSVSHGRNGVLRAVGDPVGDLQHFARQPWVTAYDLCEGIGTRCVPAYIENFLAGRPQCRDRIGLRIEERAQLHMYLSANLVRDMTVVDQRAGLSHSAPLHFMSCISWRHSIG